MAVMVPSSLSVDSPYSERRLFELLKLDPSTSDWTVLHSVGLRRTRVAAYGEIDFVVLIPDRGIVCLEVKGGRVACVDGVWTTRNSKTGEINRLPKSPYIQAREGMFALLKAIRGHFGSDAASGCPMSYGVVFLDIEALPQSIEAEPWETIEIGRLSTPISVLIERNIMKTREKLPSRVIPENISIETMAKIKRFLRPDFERVVSRSNSIRATEEQIISLTEEQYDYLDIADINDRAIVTGAAGTGKTLLALEHARRECLAGRSVLLLCYNKLLADWMQGEVKRSSMETVECKTYHGYLLSLITRSTYATEFETRRGGVESRRLYSELFPFYGELAVAELGVEFDSLVVDEAQDIISDANLGLFGSLLRGSLVGGRWLMLGDFQRQAIYKSVSGVVGQKDAFEKITSFGAKFAIVPLKVNCRNTRQIGEETALLSGFDSLPYRLAHVSGLAVDYRYWKNLTDEALQLEAALSKLSGDNVDPADIIILAPNRFEHSAASRLIGKPPFEIVDVRDARKAVKQQVKFSTIHAFKGMESPVIILCGVSDVSSEEQRSLLYVGMSRARSHLILLLSDKAKQLVPALVAKRLSLDWK